MGPSGTDGHPPPGPRAGRFSVLLRRGLQQECDGGLRRTGNDRGGLQLLSLWTGGCYGKFRPASRTPALAISGPGSDLCRPIPAKKAAYMMGLAENEIRLPLVEMTKENTQKLKSIMEKLNIKIVRD